jgi:Lactate racemase N-terminal domain
MDPGFSIVEGGLSFPLPKWRRVAQRIEAPRLESISEAVAREMRKLDGRVRPGMSVAIGVGSRGVARLAEIVRAAVAELQRRGARPFIVPAMGSHGGATPEGQLEVLKGYGVSPEALDVPFDASMETVPLGTTATGLPLHWSRAALRADAVLPINRVKPHTDFHGEVESGLSKMLAIGFGKQKGAATVHLRGFDTFHDVVPEAARLVFEKVNVLAGIASVENALEDVAHLEVVPGDQIARREPELVRMSRSLMGRIPFENLEVLVVDYLGKDVSGMGMDPNVTGRYAVRHLVDPRNPKKLAVLRLTERTHGNACGLGVADVTTRAVVENVDYQKTWTNVVASTELTNGKTPIWVPDDRSAIALAIATCPRVDRMAPRLVRIESTLHLQELWVAEALWQSDGRHDSTLRALGDAREMEFASDGNLADLPMPAAKRGRAPWSAARA